MWILIIYGNKLKSEIIKIYKFCSIKQISYVIGLTPRQISNYYHGLILPRENLMYVDIYKE